ncbi:hypothetical protein SMU58_01911 [Streptococcus mutans A19]|nr:hypothetical protein SMU58_01911 [Streptococcus mutans A19]
MIVPTSVRLSDDLNLTIQDRKSGHVRFCNGSK